MKAIADGLLAAHDAASLFVLPSVARPGFSNSDGYAVAERIRARRIARGEQPRGFKIGFTNRGIWERYGVHAPIWGPVWSSSLTLLDGPDATLSLAGLVQPRIEPEIVVGFARVPDAAMNEAELVACIEWVAHGVEIVHTHFEGWRFTAADTVADFALHGRLLVGPRIPANRFADLGGELAALRVTLLRDGTDVETGVASIVLDGPLSALRTWLDSMRVDSPSWQVRAGDVVTTGTITDAWPIKAGEHWQTRVSDTRLVGLSLKIEA
ncbi:MAG: fumarylacetoacetate hydrolase family protein [Burkholderiaceae bacterium]